ncbi:MAG: hypothetical protein ACTFAL_03630 [Candidatus Electronema sp. V4]|uniref:hypothetical protein n=1 Tax=Candidatus Electronema sp. V4 TaxID=3454756 RepID=UPI0040559B99
MLRMWETPCYVGGTFHATLSGGSMPAWREAPTQHGECVHASMEFSSELRLSCFCMDGGVFFGRSKVGGARRWSFRSPSYSRKGCKKSGSHALCAWEPEAAGG